ncbi:MAG TPA: ribonuclease PH [Gemmataceae bacterium]|nr:ribonuclease PH [Gemmataceae bacterium]
MRNDGRQPDELRPLSFKRRYTRQAPGSVLVRMGRTTVLCTCCVEPVVPPFLTGKGKGWLTAEYSMLPGSTNTRKPRDRGGKIDGRSVEIQRLIGRALRTVVNLETLGERTLWIDCDVLEADGGTRTASINGAYIALIDALHAERKKKNPSLFLPLPPVSAIVRGSVAAVSVGLLDGRGLLDLDYSEDKDADVDLNLIMTGGGDLIEVQAGGEEATFSRKQLDQLLDLGKRGIDTITHAQRAALGANWPLD